MAKINSYMNLHAKVSRLERENKELRDALLEAEAMLAGIRTQVTSTLQKALEKNRGDDTRKES